LWWPSLTKDMQTEQLLCWSSMTDTEHTTSGSNEDFTTISIVYQRVLPGSFRGMGAFNFKTKI